MQRISQFMKTGRRAIKTVLVLFIVITAWPGSRLQLAGDDRNALKDKLAVAKEQLIKDNPGVIKVGEPIFLRNGLMWWLENQPKLVNISALAGLPLTSLKLNRSSVSDLSPLKGMQLTELGIFETPVKDLSPLAGMPLKSIALGPGSFKSLTPLVGAPLEEIKLGGKAPEDLTVFKNMPLRILSITSAPKDLSPLRGMPLEILLLGRSNEVQDFSPLADLKKLKRLQMFDAQLSDLSVLDGLLDLEVLDLIACHKALDLTPLKTLPIKSLDVGQVPGRKSIDALAGMLLEKLRIDRTHVSDLSPLKGMSLYSLNACTYGPIHDYSMLRGMPLKELTVGWLPFRYNQKFYLLPDTLGFLNEINSLKRLRFGIRERGDLNEYAKIAEVGDALRKANPDYKSGVFYRLQDGAITEIWIDKCPIGDLTPLKGLKLSKIIVSRSPVKDLKPLSGVPLKFVYLRDVPVADLTPLKNMPLEVLDITGTQVSDLSAINPSKLTELILTGSKVRDCGQLKGMKLRKLSIDLGKSATGVKTLRNMVSLESINGVPVDKFWRGYDQRMK